MSLKQMMIQGINSTLKNQLSLLR